MIKNKNYLKCFTVIFCEKSNIFVLVNNFVNDKFFGTYFDANLKWVQNIDALAT